MDLLNLTISLALLVSMSRLTVTENITLPAYEYFIRFKQLLSVGHCPMKFETYGNKSVLISCNRHHRGKQLKVETSTPDNTRTLLLDNPTQLFITMLSCYVNTTNYFGLLAPGSDECMATKIAEKISFDDHHLPLLSYQYYEPRAIILQEEALPEEFTHYYNNSYYTEKIGIGTEEVILVVLTSRDKISPTRRQQLHFESDILTRVEQTIRSVSASKFKIVTFSSADRTFQSKVFRMKGVNKNGTSSGQTDPVRVAEEALNYLQKKVRVSQELVRKIRQGSVDPHVKYTFKMFEGPGLGSPFIAKEEPFQWNNVTSIFVKAHRVFLQYKKFRKYCKSQLRQQHSSVFCVCPIVLHKIMELRMLTDSIQATRLEWMSMSRDQKETFNQMTSSKLNNIDIVLDDVTSFLKKEMKKATLWN